MRCSTMQSNSDLLHSPAPASRKGSTSRRRNSTGSSQVKRTALGREKAQKVITFIECLTIPSGKGQGTAFKLEKFQKEFIRDIYEPRDQSELRVVSRAILSMARKNGKSSLIAAIAIAHLIGPEAIRNGEIYSVANDRDQASIIFKLA